MDRRIRISLVCAVLLLAACGSPQDQASEETTTSSTADVATTTPAPDTTVAAPTTTTQPSTTTTGESPDSDGASLMAALDADSSITSGRVEGSIELSGLDEATAGISEATIRFSSSFDTVSGDNAFLMDMSSLTDSIETGEDDPFGGLAAGMFGEMEVRQIGDTAYVKFPFFTAMFGAETEWVSMPADEGADFASDFETFPTDPTDLMENFDEAGATIEVVGTETVNGVEATHYQVSLDIDEMDLSAAEKAELGDSGLVTTGTVPLDIWISDDGFMVRMIMVIDGTGMDVPPEEAFDSMTMRYDVFDINGDVDIVAPPASDVTPMEDLEGAAFGGFDQ